MDEEKILMTASIFDLSKVRRVDHPTIDAHEIGKSSPSFKLGYNIEEIIDGTNNEILTPCLIRVCTDRTFQLSQPWSDAPSSQIAESASTSPASQFHDVKVRVPHLPQHTTFCTTGMPTASCSKKTEEHRAKGASSTDAEPPSRPHPTALTTT